MFQLSPNKVAEDKTTMSLNKKLASMTLKKKSKIPLVKSAYNYHLLFTC